MVHTNEMEKAEVAGTGFTDCFKGTNRRRTEIVSVNREGLTDSDSSALSGVSSTGAGMSSEATPPLSFSKRVSARLRHLTSILLSTPCTLWEHSPPGPVSLTLSGPAPILIQLVLYRYGRRTVYIGGQVFMGGILGVIGILGIFKGNTNAAYGIGSLMILLNFGYNISVGPLCKP